MGARVIKIEQPVTGDICRELYVSDVMIEGESTIFHAINRNKESYQVDLKDPEGLEDLMDVLVAESRRGEPTISLDDHVKSAKRMAFQPQQEKSKC